eukprot:scaffold51762_cov45-Phaeocystis_antarctica.AAC.1
MDPACSPCGPASDPACGSASGPGSVCARGGAAWCLPCGSGAGLPPGCTVAWLVSRLGSGGIMSTVAEAGRWQRRRRQAEADARKAVTDRSKRSISNCQCR